ncbi:MAG: calcium-binding protein [Alphaproteobacteria bacterium]|nr:calcium-binding protein [Alphaproteobacteria bacterium]
MLSYTGFADEGFSDEYVVINLTATAQTYAANSTVAANTVNKFELDANDAPSSIGVDSLTGDFRHVQATLNDDIIYTNDGGNNIFAGGGDDVIYGSSGDDYIDGEEGFDVVRYNQAATGITAVLSYFETGVTWDDGMPRENAHSDQFFRVEGLHGSDATGADNGDTIVIQNRDEGETYYIYGSEGNDSYAIDYTFSTFAGGHLLTYENITGSVVINLTATAQSYGSGSDMVAADTVLKFNEANASIGTDTLGISQFFGDDSDTALTGDFLTIEGSDGDDVIFGDDGNNSIITGLGADTVDGGGGNDFISAAPFFDTGDDTFRGGAGADNLFGWGGNDTLNGDAGDDNLYGGAGNDILNGGADADVIDGGAGADMIDGGTGIDTVTYADETSGVFVNLSATPQNGTAFGVSSGSDQLFNIENITGSELGDGLTGDDGANIILGGGGTDTLNGGAGADTLNGGAGTDFVTYGLDTAGVTVNLSTGTATDGNGDTDTLISIENITGSGSNDTLTGDDGANGLFGQAGDDTIDGGAGADMITGGAGLDRMTGGTGADHFNLNADDTARDVVTDFSRSDGDRIRINADEASYADVAALLEAAKTGLTVAVSSGDTVFTDADSNEIFVLEGFTDALTLADFEIV